MELVIVESPAKAKTIEGYLGKGFTVKSSFGHVRDLASKGISIDVENNFEPTYEVLADKKKIIKELKDLTAKASIVWLATDEDREGEAISWHLFEELKLKDDKTKRIVFNEITKQAIERAIANPRKIDKHLVDAQQARRVLDRLVGFELSPVLWKKVKPSLSAGRVQSVTVRLIVEREQEIKDFKTVAYYRVVGEFKKSSGAKLKAELSKRFETEKEANDFLNSCISAEFSISNLEVKPGKRNPAAPFTTSTLQQEASRKLGFSVSQTMIVAQKLYEAGKITYMRTDSVNLSDTALNAAKNEIVNRFGENYSQIRKFQTKSKGAQEAHECIRPTDLTQSELSGSNQEQRLYELIWKRTIASQMAEAKTENTTITISPSTRSENFVAKGEVIKFDGFLKVYKEDVDDDTEENDNQGVILPAVEVGESLHYINVTATQKFPLHPPRYTEASLVRKLENLGIGRPSTYAPTISTVQKRGYVVKEDREGEERNYVELKLQKAGVTKSVNTEISGREKSKLFPTDIGIVVNDFLVEHFKRILDFDFTAKVEQEFDEIAEGQKEWRSMIQEFYKPFHENVEDTLENSKRATGEKLLGVDPKSGKNVYAKIGKYGPMIQVGETDDENKPSFTSLRGNASITDITLEEALELFKLPKELGEFEDKKVVVGVGRFGPYVRHNNGFVSIKGQDPLDVSLEDAIKLILQKREDDANKFIKEFDEDPEIKVLNGRYGAYIKAGKKNVKIPKDKVPEELTFEDVKAIIAAEPASKGKSTKRKTKA